MLKKNIHEAVILVVFSLLLHEVLTLGTKALLGIGLLLSVMNIKIHKHLRNALAIGVFASYWLIYGKLIDPEVGLNFLTSIIIIKLLEKESARDQYMIFFGLILLLSAGSLFERTLTYTGFFAISFIVLINHFYSQINQKWKIKDLALTFFWVIPLTCFLFFFVPRIMNPFPFQESQKRPGEIGYTPDVNISEIDTLEQNDSVVFQAGVNKTLDQGQLYWRGNTLAYNDGWNWKERIQNKEEALSESNTDLSADDIIQKFRLFINAEYFFALDLPKSLSYGRTNLDIGFNTRTLSQERWRTIQRYTAVSSFENSEQSTEAKGQYLQLPLAKKIKERIETEFPGETLDEVVKSIRNHFLNNEFSYSFSPGRVTSFDQFLDKKIGLCSHYASATALILRAKGIPTRLVSGFMGGNYNRYANFYVVSQNDAHVWVEALNNGQWVRLDPTEWISPERVQLGGEAFVQSVVERDSVMARALRLPGFLKEFRFWFQQWDFLFYQWLEQMDYHAQEAWFEKINLKRQWLFVVLPIILGIFVLCYYIYLSFIKRKQETSQFDETWALFLAKMDKKGISLSRISILDNETILKNNLDENSRDQILEIWRDLVVWSYSKNDISRDELVRKIKGL